MEQHDAADNGEAFRRQEIRKNDGMDDPEADEEFSAEIVSPVPNVRAGGVRRDEELSTQARRDAKGSAGENRQAVTDADRTIGWIALIVAIAAMFYWPAVLGPAAAVIGFIAYARGNRTFGIWAAALGLLALFAFLFLVPYFS